MTATGRSVSASAPILPEIGGPVKKNLDTFPILCQTWACEPTQHHDGRRRQGFGRGPQEPWPEAGDGPLRLVRQAGQHERDPRAFAAVSEAPSRRSKTVSATRPNDYSIKNWLAAIENKLEHIANVVDEPPAGALPAEGQSAFLQAMASIARLGHPESNAP